VKVPRAERNRRAILDAALHLFSTQGYRSTSTRDIADAAGISTGALYHHFADKEMIFQSLLDEYWQISRTPEFPISAALRRGAFPDDLLALAGAAREIARQYRPYIRLVYVDVIEFDGQHIRRYYDQIADRYAAFLEANPGVRTRLRPQVSPQTAAMLVTRLFLYLYSVEFVFGVPNQFGRDEGIVLREIVEILERGILPAPSESATVNG
jgi:AcrR family transcriptional regulator